MLMSRKHKYVFIEVPKTGTSAIARRLLEIDPNLERDVIHHPDGRDEPVETSHITARRMRQILGEEAANYTFVGFLRDPVDLLVSKYFFYKVGRAKRMLDGERPTFGRWVRHWSTRLLPLSVWVLVYPYKGSAHFALAPNDALLLDALGDFATLETHFQEIFGALGYDKAALALAPTNVSDYERPRGAFFTRMANLSLRLHAPQDLTLYSLVKNGVHWTNKPAEG
ncbi:MAG: sulfotransferase family 2 domain-containing protein [Pseudomonadota bacterium]